MTTVKTKIRAYFKEHHGETFYPSDIMETLDLDLDIVEVINICEELVSDGKIAGVTP